MVTNWLRKQILRAAVSITGRNYAAAQVNRLSGDWAVTLQSADSEIRSSLKVLRARSREQAKNNDYIKRFLSMCEVNIIGSAGIGISARLQRGSDYDKANNDLIETAWRDWNKKQYASIDTMFSFKAILRLIARTLPQDGEVFIRKIEADNKYGFSLQILDADWFDENYNVAASKDGSNRIVMSVEKDKWGKPVAYYMTNPGSDPYQTQDIGSPKRVPAREIIHIFVPNRPGQTRGVPWAHTAMSKLNQLSGYEEATVVGARVGASQMGVITQTIGDTPYTGSISNDTQNLATEVQPGAVMQLPQGFDFTQFDPKQPTVNYGEFVKAMLRGVASGLSVSYNGLANDLEGVNYSSIRYGALEEREVWKSLQEFLIEHLLQDVYEAWLIRAVIYDALRLPVSLVEKAKTAVRWRARGWAWVDPLKDMKANELALGMGVTTLTRIAAENGEDIEQILQERKHEQDLINKLGLVLNDGTKPSGKLTKDNPRDATKGNQSQNAKAKN